MSFLGQKYCINVATFSLLGEGNFCVTSYEEESIIKFLQGHFRTPKMSFCLMTSCITLIHICIYSCSWKKFLKVNGKTQLFSRQVMPSDTSTNRLYGTFRVFFPKNSISFLLLIQSRLAHGLKQLLPNTSPTFELQIVLTDPHNDVSLDCWCSIRISYVPTMALQRKIGSYLKFAF